MWGRGERKKHDGLGANYEAWGAMPDSILGLVCRVDMCVGRRAVLASR